MLHLKPSRAALPPLLVLGLAGAALAQPFVYAVNEKGKLLINGTLLDSLPGNFDPGPPSMHPEDAWIDASVLGADRFALRLDGRIFKNGTVLTSSLPFAFGFPVTFFWGSLSVTPTAVYALRANGELAAGGSVSTTLPLSTFIFQRVLGLDPHVYSLRSDGAVFEDTSSTPKFQFVGGPGPGGALDGASFNTRWVAIAIDPISLDLFALRRDGKVFVGDLPSGASAGTSVGSFPPPSASSNADADRYVDLTFASDGITSTGYVLRGDGAVFTAASFVTALVDLPGDASTLDSTFTDLATSGTDFWAVRWDGRLFKNTDGIEQVNFLSDRYRSIAVSTTPPDLTSFVNAPPVAALVQTTAVAGSAVSIPVVATDSDKRAADLVVGLPLLQPANFPPGFVFTPSAGTSSIRGTLDGTASALPGSFSIRVSVDDGVNPPRLATYKLKVVAADTNPLKDRKPVFAKIKKPQAVVVGAPPAEVFELRISAVDADADVVTLSVDPLIPLPAGATFDAGTGLFSWTPDATQVGTAVVRFLATAGPATSKLTVKIRVLNGLIF
ncbi:MAG TPA: Ig domain-containing protein [Planctomycetota bacterium]|jgi:hypothetical protein|nr:Ig domain-containing protein [Planctomycetota bacterium]